MLTAKSVFRKIQSLERRIMLMEEKVSLFTAMAQRITSALEGTAVASGSTESFENSVIRLSEARDALKMMTDRYCRIVQTVTELMSKLTAPELEQVLTYHYLMHMTVLEVTKKMFISRSLFYQLHAEAMKQLDKLLSEKSGQKWTDLDDSGQNWTEMDVADVKPL